MVAHSLVRSLLLMAWLAVPSAAIGIDDVALVVERRGQDQRQFSGIYPHLASFNSQGECGTGAVVPWAGKLWWVTYSPHMPQGSDDRLYAADENLDLFVWPASVGGTPANRMIHRETGQLLIGPYLIDRGGRIRVIPPTVMPGRLTANARHLTDPQHKIYYATMEEGFYEVDVRTLAVKELFPDANNLDNHAGPLLPGYHGKGCYSGQGVLVYANNGELSGLAMTRPDIESGALAEWPGQGDWRVIRRNQFTEVSGPGGIFGNSHAPADPIWSIGWDHRSLILMLRDQGEWHVYRLPKASHCYDGAHGWNTEWPRIRAIGEDDLLMTMHGMFWRFPPGFCREAARGISPRSTYLKVIGDFCRWDDRLVFGCDDAAQNEFLNTRKAKGKVAGPVRSQSNLWFVEPGLIDRLGPAIGHGAVWLDERVEPGAPSDPFLFAGFRERGVHLTHHADAPVIFRCEVDTNGDGNWALSDEITVPARGYVWHAFDSARRGEWMRVSATVGCQATAWFEYRNPDPRVSFRDQRPQVVSDFTGLARAGQGTALGGMVRAGDRDAGLKILATRCAGVSSIEGRYYELKPDLSLVLVDSDRNRQQMTRQVAIPAGVLRLDGNSILYIDDDGSRYRLPVGNSVYFERPELLNMQRTSRETTTERDLFQCAGTLYELPARNAGGFARIRPIATHPYFIQDYCSWRGLLVLSGISQEAPATNAHIIRSGDGECAVWLGAVDDLWQLGKPVGRGGPWSNSRVSAGSPSDPYLLTGYDKKNVTISHDSAVAIGFQIQVDISGTGLWRTLHTMTVGPSRFERWEFPVGFQAYWLRIVADRDCQATAELAYE